MIPPRDLAAEAATIAAALGENYGVERLADGELIVAWLDQNDFLTCADRTSWTALLHLARRNAELERERDALVRQREEYLAERDALNEQAMEGLKYTEQLERERDEARAQRNSFRVQITEAQAAERISAEGWARMVAERDHEARQCERARIQLDHEREMKRAAVALKLQAQAERDTLRARVTELELERQQAGALFLIAERAQIRLNRQLLARVAELEADGPDDRKDGLG